MLVHKVGLLVTAAVTSMISPLMMSAAPPALKDADSYRVTCPGTKKIQCVAMLQPPDNPCRAGSYGWRNGGPPGDNTKAIPGSQVWCTVDGQPHDDYTCNFNTNSCSCIEPI